MRGEILKKKKKMQLFTVSLPEDLVQAVGVGHVCKGNGNKQLIMNPQTACCATTYASI